MKIKQSVITLFSLLIIAGCGLKGDLYEPTNEPTDTSVAVNPVIAESETKSLESNKQEPDAAEANKTEKAPDTVELDTLKDKQNELHYQPTESALPQ